MSVKILEGTLDTLELLLFIPSNKFITSSRIREKFGYVKLSTLHAKLRKLSEEGLIEIEKKKLDRAGDDKHGYKLSKHGIDIRNNLRMKGMQILESEIRSVIQKQIDTSTKTEEKDKDRIIKDFLMEFYEESREVVSEEKVNELQQILKRLLKSYL